jgi:hypothetical protein
MSRCDRPIVAVEVDRQVAEDAQWNFADGKTELRGHVEDEKVVYARLIARGPHQRGAGQAIGIARVEGVKGIAGAGVVIDGGRELEVGGLGEVELRAELPAVREVVVFDSPEWQALLAHQ